MIRRSLLVAALVLAVCSAAFAQTTSSIRGYVKDEQGGVLPGLTVTATSPDALSPASAVTDSDGYYRVINLPPGTYSVTAELAGFAALTHQMLYRRLQQPLNLVHNVFLQAQTYHAGVVLIHLLELLLPYH